MNNLKRFIGSAICILGFVTSVYAANPASKEYVDQKIKGLQTQINNIKPGMTYTAGSGISIVDNVITNSSPGITYTAGTGISISGSTISSTLGFAEFIHNIQPPNINVSPGTAFTIDTEVFNSVPTAIVASLGAGGTVYTLSIGTYVLDYEMSLSAAGSIGLYTGSSVLNLNLDNNTIAGSTTGTTWIHGRAFVVVSTTPVVVAVSPVTINATVTTAGIGSSYMIRLTILKMT